jgi:hypothetical protein
MIVENGVCFKKRRSLNSDTVAPPADHRVGNLVLAGEDEYRRRWFYVRERKYLLE